MIRAFLSNECHFFCSLPHSPVFFLYAFPKKAFSLSYVCPEKSFVSCMFYVWKAVWKYNEMLEIFQGQKLMFGAFDLAIFSIVVSSFHVSFPHYFLGNTFTSVAYLWFIFFPGYLLLVVLNIFNIWAFNFFHLSDLKSTVIVYSLVSIFLV